MKKESMDSSMIPAVCYSYVRATALALDSRRETINVLPHPPPTGLHTGLIRGFDERFPPRGGEFDDLVSNP